jgi:putative membrane protein
MGRVFGDDGGGSGVARELGRAFLGKGGLPVGRILVGLLAFLAFLLAVRLLSIVWSLIRLHGFRLTLEGDDLRVEYGLLTRVTATVPVHRIQSVTVLEGPLHRLVGRVAVKVQTAGGGGQQREASTESEWIAPILRREELSALLAAMGPELAIEGASWNPPHPRAFRRELKGWVIVAIVLSLPFALALRFWDLALLSALLGLGALAARLTVRHMAWAVTAGAVLYRSGFLWRHLTIARCDKVQAVARTESPFDRRAGMAGVRVDTAGGGELSHRVDIPYLARQTADELAALLSARAARTAFRW